MYSSTHTRVSGWLLINAKWAIVWLSLISWIWAYLIKVIPETLRGTKFDIYDFISAISLREKVTCNEEMMMSAFHQTKHDKLDLYNTSSQKQWSAGRHIAPLRHISWFWANQSLLLLLKVCVYRRISIYLYQFLSHWSDSTGARTYDQPHSGRARITITPPMRSMHTGLSIFFIWTVSAM